MSFLPQRKKSAEEIAQLRDSLGIPVAKAPVDKEESTKPIPDVADDAFDLKPNDSLVDDFSFVPMLEIGPEKVRAVAQEPKPLEVKFANLDDISPIEEGFALPVDSASPEPIVPEPAPPVLRVESVPVKPEVSPQLVMSPQAVPPLQPETSAEQKIPSQKHSMAEIERLRRQMAFAQVESVYDPRLQKAHPLLVALGYIPVLAAVVMAFYYQQPVTLTVPFVGFSVLIALIILIRKPISRHHAGFIFAICFLAIAFGILHYFPQLQHAA